uniref:Kazal-like domain-containing protein n=1 Tax=Spermophilus dauricus TaxID=99837 RepID=A0A8C9PZZ9_SPEDA
MLPFLFCFSRLQRRTSIQSFNSDNHIYRVAFWWDSPGANISLLYALFVQDSEMCKQYRVLPRMGFLCPKDLRPVCGDDGQTYNNPCMLCLESSGNSLKVTKPGHTLDNILALSIWV